MSLTTGAGNGTRFAYLDRRVEVFRRWLIITNSPESDDPKQQLRYERKYQNHFTEKGLRQQQEKEGSMSVERLVPESQVRAIVQAEIKKFFAQMVGVDLTPKDRWLTTKQAARELGKSSDTLLAWKDSPEFKHGIHFRSTNPPGQNRKDMNSTYLRWPRHLP